MLNEKQKLTIEHLGKYKNIYSVLDIIKYCVDALDRPRRDKGHKEALEKGTAKNLKTPRRHSKKHYQDIIDYLAQGGELETKNDTTIG